VIRSAPTSFWELRDLAFIKEFLETFLHIRCEQGHRQSVAVGCHPWSWGEPTTNVESTHGSLVTSQKDSWSLTSSSFFSVPSELALSHPLLKYTVLEGKIYFSYVGKKQLPPSWQITEKVSGYFLFNGIVSFQENNLLLFEIPYRMESFPFIGSCF
jgi:hypothetical protein